MGPEPLPKFGFFIIGLIMATTPDLPPGARFRMWALFVFTAVVGVAMYATFERFEGLLVAGGVLIILLYLLLGVRLTIQRDRAAVADLVDDVLNTLQVPFWAILDGHQGTVLHLSKAGKETLSHDPAILVGQRFTDLALEVSPRASVAVVEMLRFGAVGQQWSGELAIKAQDGRTISVAARVVPLKHKAARSEGLVILGP